MIASVHLADVGVRSALALNRKAPSPGSIPGLRHANIALAAPLGGSVLPTPQFSRVGLIAFWEDDDAIDGFLSSHPLAAKLSSGWHTRLEPLRAHGTWPGLPTDLPKQRAVEHEGPVAALTLGRPRVSQFIRFTSYRSIWSANLKLNTQRKEGKPVSTYAAQSTPEYACP